MALGCLNYICSHGSTYSYTYDYNSNSIAYIKDSIIN